MRFSMRGPVTGSRYQLARNHTYETAVDTAHAAARMGSRGTWSLYRDDRFLMAVGPGAVFTAHRTDQSGWYRVQRHGSASPGERVTRDEARRWYNIDIPELPDSSD